MSARLLASLLLAATLVGCDAPQVVAPATSTQTTTAAPVQVQAKLWGAVPPQARYQVRAVPDAGPALFHEDGKRLLSLLPELVLDAGAADKPRPIPTTRRFELVKLEPKTEGGFALYGRLADENGQFDLIVEAGPNDPRVHVGLTSKFARDVRVHRLVVRFDVDGAAPSGLGHDFGWSELEDEWTSPAHVPAIVRFGDDLTVMATMNVDAVTVRSAGTGYHVDLELFHYEAHPIEVGERCGEELDGATAANGERWHSRADLVVGPTDLPLVVLFPNARRAAVSLNDVHEGGVRAFAATDLDATPTLATRQAAWLGPSVADLPCAEGRFATLAAAGTTAAWAGTTMVSSGANLLAPTETDARRVFAFRHPQVKSSALFSLSDGDVDPGWFDPAALARLVEDRGLIVVRAPLDELLGRDAGATKTVRESLADASRNDVWLAAVDDVAMRLVAMPNISLALAPDGVVTVRNTNDRGVRGVTLLLPEGTQARYSTGVPHSNSGRHTSFDLDADARVTLQIVRDAEPATLARPAQIEVATP